LTVINRATIAGSAHALAADTDEKKARDQLGLSMAWPRAAQREALQADRHEGQRRIAGERNDDQAIAGDAQLARKQLFRVAGEFEAAQNGARSAVSNAAGVATTDSPTTRKSGSFKYTITGVTAPGYAYDASLNKMTSNAITK
jgi:hypothetical protein